MMDEGPREGKGNNADRAGGKEGKGRRGGKRAKASGTKDGWKGLDGNIKDVARETDKNDRNTDLTDAAATQFQQQMPQRAIAPWINGGIGIGIPFITEVS